MATTQPSTASDRAIYRLAGAILLQAIQDATSSSIGKRASALRWMSRHEECYFSFPFICRILSRDPFQVRRFCECRAAQRRLSEWSARSSRN